jgi:predicted nucleotide-binding protein
MASDRHKACAGLLDVAHSEEELLKGFEIVYKKAFPKSAITNNIGEYPFVKIVDTFFSDTMPQEFLTRLVHDSQIVGFSIKFILLNPFSELAKARASNLNSGQAIRRINRGLYRIRRALEGKSATQTAEFDGLSDSADYIFTQLEEIQGAITSKNYSNIELKFATVSHFPLYVFGPYACAGHFLEYASANVTPWCFWVDDPAELDDQYSCFGRHFDTLWEKAYPLTRPEVQKHASSNGETLFKLNKKNIFISYGKDENTKNKLQVLCLKHNYVPKTFDIVRDSINSDEIQRILAELYSSCNSAVVIMTKDDFLKNGQWRARQNVLIELGYAQRHYGPLVLLLVEDGLEVPTNLSGLIVMKFTKSKDGNPNLDQLKMREFFDRVDRAFI